MMKKYVLLPSAALALLMPVLAYAQELWVYCGGLPGCPGGWTEYFSNALALLLLRLPAYIKVFGWLFIMVGGAYILLSAGNAERVTKGKNTIIWAVIGLFLAQFADVLVGYVALEVPTIVAGTDLVESVGNTLISTVTDLFYIALLGVAVYCGMRMAVSLGKEEEFTKARDGLFYAAVGAIIINLSQQIANAILTF
ncbi:MAG: hypothetical protein WC840_02850 [Candidatus Peribacteraceae bacterium]